MASVASLLRGGSFLPDASGGFTFKIDTKFKWDTKRLQDKIGKANAKSLKVAGMDVRKAAQKAMSNRRPLSTPRQWRIASRQGFELVALINRVPKPDVVTSWRTSRNPRGELRRSIESDYDFSRKTVVIGPSAERMRPQVNITLEKGGTTTHYFVPVRRNPPGRRRNVVYGRLRNSRPNVAGTRIPQSGIFSFTRQVRGRGFMEKGLAKAMPKIAERWRNSIQGP